jgi:hypothetical protein
VDNGGAADRARLCPSATESSRHRIASQLVSKSLTRPIQDHTNCGSACGLAKE